MSDRINLESYAKGCISDALWGVAKLDIDKLRDDVREQAGSAAENACIYTHHCYQIISDYESRVGSEMDDYLSEELVYAAGGWRDAMTAYAKAMALSVIDDCVGAALDDIEAAAEDLCDKATYADAAPEDRGSIEPEDLCISTDCPHGWAPHDREDEDGVHYWSPAHLEGCRALAVKVAGVWLSYTWAPGGEG